MTKFEALSELVININHACAVSCVPPGEDDSDYPHLILFRSFKQDFARAVKAICDLFVLDFPGRGLPTQLIVDPTDAPEMGRCLSRVSELCAVVQTLTANNNERQLQTIERVFCCALDRFNSLQID